MLMTDRNLERLECRLQDLGFLLLGGAVVAVVLEHMMLAKILSIVGLLSYTISKAIRIYDVLFVSDYKKLSIIYLVTINLILGGLSFYIMIDLLFRYFGH